VSKDDEDLRNAMAAGVAAAQAAHNTLIKQLEENMADDKGRAAMNAYVSLLSTLFLQWEDHAHVPLDRWIGQAHDLKSALKERRITKADAAIEQLFAKLADKKHA